MNISHHSPALSVQGKTAWAWAGLYLAGSRPWTKTASEPDVSARDCGVLNERLSWLAVSAAYHGDMACVETLLGYVPALVSREWDDKPWDEKGYWEFCLGRAGMLYLLRLVRAWVPEAERQVDEAIGSVCEAVLRNGPPWFYIRGDIDSVGMGHGRIGIVVQVILSDPGRYGADERVLRVLEEVLAWQDASTGNWPKRVPGSCDEADQGWDMVQWCHGAPGVVQGLVDVREYVPERLWESIDRAVELGRKCTWEWGLLRKEPNMCHGTTGNAFTFPPGPLRDYFLSYTTEEVVREGLEKGGEGKEGTGQDGKEDDEELSTVRYENCDYGLVWSLGLGAVSRVVGWLFKDKEKRCFLGVDDV